jgi:hypothetical protein
MSTLQRILTLFIIGAVCEVALMYAFKYTHSHRLLNLYAVLLAMIGLPFSFSFACLIGYILDGEDFTL